MSENIKVSEVSDILRKQLEGINANVQLDEIGTVLQVSDGVVRIYGLRNAEANELLEFDNGLKAIVMNLEEDNVGAVLLGPTDKIKEGFVVKRTKRIASIRVGEGMLGRVIDPLGEPLDGKGLVGGELYDMPLERKAPGVIYRQPVNQPLQTGLKAVDAMIPIGRGQRELIIGDRQTGKTAIAIDTIINQVCVSVSVDGTAILTVPRYACEKLEPGSTWQTTAWGNSDAYLKDCRNAGIKHPVGMCFQDAGWKNGPWLGSGKNTKNNSIYMTWRDYIENVSIGKTDDNWYFSQEDIHVNLMWGSQVLQKIAQEVRVSENRIVMAEKMSVMAYLENKYICRQADMDEAWRTLMLAQHHDSWIVPYNGLNRKGTWADQIKRWTDSTNHLADGIIEASMQSFNEKFIPQNNAQQQYIRVFNTLGMRRKEIVSVLLPTESENADLSVYDWKGKDIGCLVENEGKEIRLFFEAEIPPFGYSTYCIKKKEAGKKEASESRFVLEGNKVNKQEYVVENDMYKIVFDLSKGGTIKSLIAKKEGNKDFAGKTEKYALGELRGFFYEEGKFRSSIETPAKLTVVRDNVYEQKIKIEGEIASHPFTQVITLTKGTRRIDFDLTVGWKKNVGIGEYKEERWRDNRRAYCDDRFKLSVLFPTDLHSPRVYKNAPFDVCESKLTDTFFGSWDQIKHNIILHWVDLAEQEGDYALALLSDHTTSYSYGEDYPLGLTAQYSGGGLWGPDYKITHPLRMKYAIIPHRGKWDKASIADDSDCWNEPLLHSCYPVAKPESKSFIDLQNTGYQVSALQMKDGKVLLRLFNSEGDEKLQKVTIDMPLSGVEEVDLNGQCIERKKIKTRAGKSEMTISMPRFGIKTFVLSLT